MKRNRFVNFKRAVFVALFIAILLPVGAFAQRRLVVRRSNNRVVIYQTRPSVIYRQQPYYGYRNSYPQSYYYSNGYYSQPYYSSGYNSYSYSPYNYSSRYYTYPSQSYYYPSQSYYYVDPGYQYGRRHRRNGLSFSLRLR